EVAQERVDRQARIAGVVLEPREPLLRRAADDRAVTQHGRRRAVRFTDPEHDHAATMIAANGERTSTPTPSVPSLEVMISARRRAAPEPPGTCGRDRRDPFPPAGNGPCVPRWDFEGGTLGLADDQHEGGGLDQER